MGFSIETLIDLFWCFHVVYPYEYMDNWERFDETSLPDKKAFYSELSLKEI